MAVSDYRRRTGMHENNPKARDKFRTVSDGVAEYWYYVGTNEEGEILIRTEVDGTEYTRRLEPTRDELERTATDWRCVDDPDGFDEITHLPYKGTPEPPFPGDITSRAINGVSLLYRVSDVKPRNGYKIAHLTLVGDVLGYQPTSQVIYTEGNGWQWDDNAEAHFTSGAADELALKASRMDATHQMLRSNYFYCEEVLAAPDVMSRGKDKVFTIAQAAREAYAKQLFLVETGLLPEQADDGKFEEFYEALHQEFLASREG
jgi:hypothetical protein